MRLELKRRRQLCIDAFELPLTRLERVHVRREVHAPDASMTKP